MTTGSPGGRALADLELRFAREPESDAYFPLAEAYLAEGRVMEAKVVCKSGLKHHQHAPEPHVLMGRILLAEKKYARALKALDAALAIDPAHADALAARGRIHLDEGRQAEGVADLRRASQIDPSGPAQALLQARGLAPVSPVPRGEAPPASGRAEPEEENASELEDEPSKPQVVPSTPLNAPSASEVHPLQPSTAPASRAVRLEGEDELEALARAGPAAPARGRPWVTLALFGALAVATAGVITWRFISKARVEAIDALTAQARPAFEQDLFSGYRAAAQAYETILREHDAEHGPTLARLSHALAILWGEHGEDAVESRLRGVLDRARAIAPEDSNTWAASGLLALHEAPDRGAGAQAALEILEPRMDAMLGIDASPVHLVAGLAQLAEGEYGAAQQRLDRVRQAGVLRVRSTLYTAVAAYRTGKREAARSLLQEVLRMESEHPRALATLAMVELRRGRLQSAARQLEKFAELEERGQEVSPRSRALARYARSEVVRSSGQDERADRLYDQAVELDPKNPDFPHGLGRWYLSAQRADEALARLQQAVALEPTRYAFLVDLAEAEMMKGDFDAASAHIDRALEANPRFLPALLARARYLRRTNAPGAADFLQRLETERPSAKIEVALEQGRLLRQRDDFAAARAVLEEAIEGMDGSPPSLQSDVLLSFGRLMDDMKELGVAQRVYAKAGELGELEAWYRLSVTAYRSGDMKTALDACRRYLEAGEGLRYAKNARAICDRVQAAN